MRNKSFGSKISNGVRILFLVLVCVCFVGCAGKSGNNNADSPKASRSIEYGIGAAALGDTIGKEWEAIQDGPAYSDGKVSAQIDSNNQITKVFAYFGETDMANDYVLYFGGESYSSIESITSKFGEFNSDSVIEYSDEKATLHVEITNKDKNEYYISVKEAD